MIFTQARLNEPSNVMILIPNIISGLEQTPNFLIDTMLPNVRPEIVAEAAVLANGGYDPCHYAVRMIRN